MIALDTNVIVRIVTGDDPEQVKMARKIFESESLWVCKTVLLETEWVLRYSYQLSPEPILLAFRKLLGYPRLQAEDREAVLQALRLFEGGMDFADALHLASSGDAERFATFDRPLANAARELAAEPVVDLLSPSRR
jgi:predicted nucleic-acid-binding protein